MANLDENISLFPNPANNGFTIELSSPVRKVTDIEILNDEGKAVKENFFKIGEKSKLILTNDLTSGIYLVHLISENQIIHKRLVIVY